jgi:glycerol-3-phosphate dehydrogenase
MNSKITDSNKRTNNDVYDIAVIGGGINGCGIARDAAGRGLSVALFEKNDLASGTSSSSTKLIHGGLRYLEHNEFRLVRESLKEREVLLNMAPHISWPLRFVFPHLEGLRPAWLIRFGLFLYDQLGGRKILPGCASINLTTDPAGIPLKDEMTRGFEYSDCWVDDARLVVLTAMDAAQHGAQINVRTEVLSAHRQRTHWEIATQDHLSSKKKTIKAKVLINASGPWVEDVLSDRIKATSKSKVRLVKGSHIVVKKLFNHNRAYIFQNADGRITFTIPYLCTAASSYFKKLVRVEDVVWTYSGVRPLFDSGEASAQKATRDYVLELDAPNNEPALLNVFGGKITTFRCLAEDAMKKLSEILQPANGPWTRNSKLPGGDFPIDKFDALKTEFCEKYPNLDTQLITRLIRSYGTLAEKILDGAQNMHELGTHFGAGLYQAEVEYLRKYEWARTTDDILWRRTKLGLKFIPQEVEKLDQWLQNESSELPIS